MLYRPRTNPGTQQSECGVIRHKTHPKNAGLVADILRQDLGVCEERQALAQEFL